MWTCPNGCESREDFEVMESVSRSYHRDDKNLMEATTNSVSTVVCCSICDGELCWEEEKRQLRNTYVVKWTDEDGDKHDSPAVVVDVASNGWVELEHIRVLEQFHRECGGTPKKRLRIKLIKERW